MEAQKSHPLQSTNWDISILHFHSWDLHCTNRFYIQLVTRRGMRSARRRVRMRVDVDTFHDHVNSIAWPAETKHSESRYALCSVKPLLNYVI